MVDGSILRSRFGDRARELMTTAGMETADLAAQSELPAGRVEKILAGADVSITLNDMEAIANVLGISLYSLLAP